MLQVVIIQPVDNGNKPHPFGHAVVAGIERYPSKITRRMSKARQDKRSKVKPFIKVINYNHLMPTRYTLELEGLKGAISADTFKEVSQREDAKKTVKKVLEERYTSGKNRWFFTALRTSYPLIHDRAMNTCRAGHGIWLRRLFLLGPSAPIGHTWPSRDYSNPFQFHHSSRHDALSLPVLPKDDFANMNQQVFKQQKWVWELAGGGEHWNGTVAGHIPRL